MDEKQINEVVSIVRTAIKQGLDAVASDMEKRLESAIASIDQRIDGAVTTAIKALPAPKDGKDGQDASHAMLYYAVKAYMAANPVAVPEPLAPTADDLANAVSAHMAANPVKPPEPLAPQPADIAKAVERYMEVNPVQAPEAIAPTPDQISHAVKAHMELHPVKPLAPEHADIAKAVTDYLVANPVPVPAAPEPLAPTEAQLDAAVAKHFEGFEVNVPEPSPELIAKAVTDYMQANPVPVPQAPEALAPTDDQVARVVAKHLQANPPKQGERGMDAAEITILPHINPERRYAKGTYAKWGGGMIRAARDTDPGEPLQNGWDVVVDGVRALDVHPLGGGEFAVKTILTGGQSDVVKITLPTFEASYKDVWKESAGEYKRGDLVTHKGGVWMAKAATTERPGAGEGWKLVVKAGRDGKSLDVVKLDRPEVYRLGAA